MTSVLASALVTAGFDAALAARGTALIMTWRFPRVAIEDNDDDRRGAKRRERARSFVAGLSAIASDSYPTAARIGPEFFSLSMEEIFVLGLDSIIAGLGASDA